MCLRPCRAAAVQAVPTPVAARVVLPEAGVVQVAARAQITQVRRRQVAAAVTVQWVVALGLGPAEPVLEQVDLARDRGQIWAISLLAVSLMISLAVAAVTIFLLSPAAVKIQEEILEVG